MLKKIFFIMLSLSILSCSAQEPILLQSKPPALISADFISNDEYRIVCYGYPKPDLTGVARRASAERAAKMNAHYFVRQRFDSSVNPGTDGTVKKITSHEDYAIIHYIVKKKNLKAKLLK